MLRCVRCGLPETHETIEFGADGVCNICSDVGRKESIDWPSRLSMLQDLIDTSRGRGDYDLIVPFSGGKDSTFTLLHLVREFKVKPLVVRFNHGFMRPQVEENFVRTIRTLGVDVLDFTPNWHLVRRLMLQSLIDKGDFCWHCHTGVFSYPMWVAVEKRIPLVVWGEPSAEYTAYFSYGDVEEVDETRFSRFVNLGISAEDMDIRLGGAFDRRDFKPYTYPPLAALKALELRSVCLGSFIPWDTQRQGELIRQELGWEGAEVENVPATHWYEKIECQMQGVRDYLKFVKRGYSRPSHLAALDVRNGRLRDVSEATYIQELEGRRPASLDVFLEILGLEEEEFLRIAREHEVSPHQFDATLSRHADPLPEMSRWSRDGALDRATSRAVLHENGLCGNCSSGCSTL